MGRWLIIGASGYVGRYLRRLLPAEGYLATYHKTPIPGGAAFNSAANDLNGLLKKHGRFTHALLLHGVTKPELCFRNESESEMVNIESMKRLIDTLVDRGIMPIYFSSEVVFDGRHGNYTEKDKPNSLMLYGRQKALMEAYCAGLNHPSLVLRLARVVGTEPGDGTLFTDWLDELTATREIRCASDQTFSPIHAVDAARAIVALVRKNVRGLVNVAGAQASSRQGMLEQLLEAVSRRMAPWPGKVTLCSIDDFFTNEPRPKNVSLNIDKMIEETGSRPRSIGAIAQESCDRWLANMKGRPW